MTFLFQEHVFGPIVSRRLGSSLGINLLSTEQKVCNFDCVYCECGLTDKPKNSSKFASAKDVLITLEDKLIELKKEHQKLDVITFAGNGEPTLHPKFLSIIQGVVTLRNKYFPSVKIAVLTNGTTLNKKSVLNALQKIDKAIIKLDAGSDTLLQKIDRPLSPFKMEDFIKKIAALKGKVIIQSMFLKDASAQKKFTNTSKEDVEKWLEQIKKINPVEVQIYSIDRDVPTEGLEKVNKKTLLNISKKVSALKIPVTVV
ncbi:MAG: radical SAM protein [Bacteroidia bacterium]